MREYFVEAKGPGDREALELVIELLEDRITKLVKCLETRHVIRNWQCSDRRPCHVCKIISEVTK